MVFYVGFLVGTLLCGIAPSYEWLLAARIVTGVFGGVIGSICLAIITDLFPLSMRGRVMGTVQTSFSVAQVAGLPAGLALSSWWGWHAPFLVIAGVGAVAGVGIALVLQPIDAHLKVARQQRVLVHMLDTVTKPAHLRVFGATVMLASGFMLMPLLSAFFVNNLHIDLDHLPLIFMVTGAVTIFMGPLVGKLADSFGKLAVFSAGTVLCAAVFLAWGSLSGATALWLVIVVNVLMNVANTGRMIGAATLMSAVPAPADRGAFMSINTSLQQVTGGIASFIGGAVVVVHADGSLGRFDTLAYVVAGSVVVAWVPIWLIARQLKAR
jgi:predicted MFS family arabinose efflux permease